MASKKGKLLIVDDNVLRGGYNLILTLVSIAIGIPVAIVLVNRFLERYAERITGYWWIFVSAAIFAMAVSIISVLWQTRKAAKTNPAIELKKE